MEPGPFRTDWAGRSPQQTPNRIAEDAETAGARLKTTSDIGGMQAGDPVRSGETIIALTENRNPPRHLVLGQWRHDAVVERLQERFGEMKSRRDAASATTSRRPDRAQARPASMPSGSAASRAR